MQSALLEMKPLILHWIAPQAVFEESHPRAHSGSSSTYTGHGSDTRHTPSLGKTRANTIEDLHMSQEEWEEWTDRMEVSRTLYGYAHGVDRREGPRRPRRDLRPTKWRSTFPATTASHQ